MIWATLMGETPTSTAALTPGLVMDRAGPPDLEALGPALRDDIIGSLFGAGLNLHHLADRLSDPQDQSTLDAAVQHLDDVVRDVRLMLHAIDRPI